MKTMIFYRVRSWDTVGGIEFPGVDSPVTWNNVESATFEANAGADRALDDGISGRRFAVLRVTEETVMECGRLAVDMKQEPAPDA